MNTEYRGKILPMDSPIIEAIEITPDDDVNLTKPTRAIYVGGEGNITVIMAKNGNTVVFENVVGVLPIVVSRILDSGTTATNIIAIN